MRGLATIECFFWLCRVSCLKIALRDEDINHSLIQESTDLYLESAQLSPDPFPRERVGSA